ncbi:mannose-6-phosphate isomerase, class I [Compostibacter hankyongensis]|uniref:mannose-6-phosphate isomerase n=1 Tax=Compostibacter hankyongensis TaxID=1007089 RepID=A0ABP8FLG8_9BACT
MNGIFSLEGKVQHYAWGGYTFIPQLLGRENPEHEPWAEYWMGAHDKAPSEITGRDGGPVPLNRAIADAPERFLGTETARRFGRLPYLFKVLDVQQMLSIQVHPTKAEAEAGFARENAAGIAPDAPERNYKDDNHKPEVMVALSRFWLLHGFKPEAALRRTLTETPELTDLLPVFEAGGYRELYREVMEWSQQEVSRRLQPLLERVLPRYKAQELSRRHPDFWAARAVECGISSREIPDRGIFSIYFFNIVQLEPGEAIFQAAGIPHAYLEGQNMELMANSDNVLRGGLTPKHVDVPELLKHTRFEAVTPAVLTGAAGAPGEQVYACPVPDFTISRFILEAGMPAHTHRAFSAEILLTTAGSAVVTDGTGKLVLPRGAVALVAAGSSYTLHAEDGATLFRAGVPL